MALRVGNEAKWKIYTAGGLGVLALALLVHTLFSLFGGSSPTPATVQSVVQHPTGLRRSNCPAPRDSIRRCIRK
jgi:hypothetical protein